METGELSICSRRQFQQQNVQSFCSPWCFALAFAFFVVSCFAVMEIKFQPSYVIMCCIMQRMGLVHWKMVANKNKILVTWRSVQANSTRSDRLLNSSKTVFTLKSTDRKKKIKKEASSFFARRERHYRIKSVGDDLIFLKIKSHDTFFIPVSAWKCKVVSICSR